MPLTESVDRARLRTCADKLRTAGLPNADQLLRLGAASLAERCFEAWDGQDRAVLAQMLKQGGPSSTDRRLSERERIVAERNWWQAGYSEEAAS